MTTTPNLGLSQLTEDEEFDIYTYNADNLKVDTFAGTIPTKRTLYSNANGSGSTIALSDSAANYDSVLISWIDNDGYNHSDIPCVNGKKALLSTAYILAAQNGFMKSAVINVSGTSVSFESNREMLLPAGTISSGVTPVKITKVVGVKGF